MTCVKCNEARRGGAPSCPNCGQQFGGQTSGAPAPSSQATSVPPPAAPRITGSNVPRHTAQGKTNGMAVTSLILGILGFLTCGVTGLVGLILGIVGLNQIKNSGGLSQGQGLAVAGIIVSGITLLSIPVMAAIVFPVFAKARDEARETSCMSNQRIIATALAMYAQDNEELYPKGSDWPTVLSAYTGVEKAYHCPSASRQGTIQNPSYGMNAAVQGLPQGGIMQPNLTLLLADSEQSENLIRSHEHIDTGRHRGFNAAFVDGHVDFLAADETPNLNPFQ